MKVARRDLMRSLLIGLASVGLAPVVITSSLYKALALPTEPSQGAAAQDPGLVSSLVGATVSVPSLGKAIAEYGKWLGLDLHWRGKISSALAQAWDAPAMKNRPAATMGLKNLQRGLFRLVETHSQPVPAYITIGWLATEIRTRDLDDLAKRLEGSPFTRWSGPADLVIGGRAATMRTMQVVGSAGEVFYLNQSLAPGALGFPEGKDLGPIFIVVLASRPYTQTLEFYGKILGMKGGMESEYALKNANKALNLPMDRKIRLSVVHPNREGSIEIDDYPPEAKERITPKGSLPPGISMCTFTTPDIERLEQAIRPTGRPYRRLDAGPSDPPYRAGRVLVCRGYSDELLEFIEQRDT